MANFIEQTQELFIPSINQTNELPSSPENVRQRKNNLSYTTGLPKEEVDKVTDENGKPIAPVSYGNIEQSSLEDRLTSGASLQELQAAADKKVTIDYALRQAEVLSAVDVANATDDGVNAQVWKTQRRLARIQERLMDNLHESTGGIADSVAEFIDGMAYTTYAGLQNLPQGITGYGTQADTEADEIFAAASTMSEEEYNAWENEYISRIGDKGVLESLGNTSSWAYSQALQSVDQAGTNLYHSFGGAFETGSALLDVGTLGLSGVLKVAKVGRSFVGALRGASGTLKATEAAENTALVLRTGLDGEIVDNLAIPVDRLKLPAPEGHVPTPKDTSTFGGRVKNISAVDDAELIDDMVPEALASTMKPRETPPVSVGRIKNKWTERTFVSKFLKREANNSFGASFIADEAEGYAQRHAAKMAEASSTRVLTYNVQHEGLQNYKASIVFGRQDGTPFKTFNDALKEQSKFPNSVVVDTRTNKVVTAETKSGQFAIRSETRISYGDVAKPMDVAEPSHSGIFKKLLFKGRTSTVGRLLSPSHYGSSTYLSNLADAAEFGHLGFHKDIELAFKEINRLPFEDADAMNNILSTLRDTPTVATVKTWLTPDVFISKFKVETGRAPSIEVIKAYEHVIEMNDFSYFTMASDRLRAMAAQKASIVKVIGGRDAIVYPTTKTVKSLKESGTQVWLTDVSTGNRVSVKGLRDDQAIMAYGHRQGDYADYVVNFEGKLRLPNLEDAYPYNAGGPRTNKDIGWFVGDTDNGWATLIGTRSEAEANQTVKEFNAVSKEFKRIFPSELPKDVLSALSKADTDKLNTLIKANNTWNTSITDVEEFIEFSKSRGVKVNSEILPKQRDTKLATFAKGINDNHLLDLSVEKYSAYHRHDLVLREFGGDLVSNPSPITAIADQFNHMVNRAAQTQYRMESTTSWWKAVQKAMETGLPEPKNLVGAMTDEARVRNLVIEGDSAVAKKLRREQDVIKRRLNMYDGLLPQVADGLDRINTATFETIYSTHKGMGNFFKEYLGVSLKGASQKASALGFYQKIADPSQALLQSANVANIIAMSPKNGSRAAVMAGFARSAAREGNSVIIKAFEDKLASFLGLNPEQNTALLEHLYDSGRGYMRGAIVEDTVESMGLKSLQKSGAGKVLGGFFRTAKNIGSAVGNIVRIPFYAGENFSATTSRIAAYLDTIEKFPTLSVKSKEFWNEVQKLDRTYSFGMNTAQKSLAASGDISKVITQWTAYPINAVQTILWGEGLSVVQKARLGVSQAVLWGAAGIGLYNAGATVSEYLPDWVGELVQKGVADYALSNTVGIEIGQRVSVNLFDLYHRARDTFVDRGNTIPAVKIVSGTALAALNAFADFGTGRIQSGAFDLERLARTWKVVDNGFMAYNMMMNDVRISNTSTITNGPFTLSQEFFQLVGFAPDKTVDEQHIRNLVFDVKKRQTEAVKIATPYYKRAIELAKEGNYAAAEDIIYESDSILQHGYGLSGTALREARDTVMRSAGFDAVNSTLVTLLGEGYTQLSENIVKE